MNIAFNSRPRWLRLVHRYGEWHTWFAWRPVRVGCDTVVWWENVDRLRSTFGWNYQEWQSQPRKAPR